MKLYEGLCKISFSQSVRKHSLHPISPREIHIRLGSDDSTLSHNASTFELVLFVCSLRCVNISEILIIICILKCLPESSKDPHLLLCFSRKQSLHACCMLDLNTSIGCFMKLSSYLPIWMSSI